MRQAGVFRPSRSLLWLTTLHLTALYANAELSSSQAGGAGVGRSLLEIPKQTEKPAAKADAFIREWGLIDGDDFTEDPKPRRKGRPLDAGNPQEARGESNVGDRQMPASEGRPKPAKHSKQRQHAESSAHDPSDQVQMRGDMENAAAAHKPAVPRTKTPRSFGKRRKAKSKGAVDETKSDPMEGCKIFVLDLAQLAEKEGLPACNVDALAAQPLTQRLLPNPLVADPAAAAELDKPPETLAWQYPYTHWAHNYSQHAAPWYIKQEIVGSKLHTTNLSEATVVLVDDYCYFSWAIADLRAKGHWWLDTHKHYKSDFKVGAHLLELYHAMVHENSFIHKQGRNFLFVAPQTTFDFGDWKKLDEYVAMSCEHFSNSMHIVFDQVQRWRCGQYRPGRTLVAPLSVADATAAPPPDAERPLTLSFRGSCTPDGGKQPEFAGKRLRARLVRVLAKSGPDVAAGCTNEDKSGLGPAAVEQHSMLTHMDYMREMGRSKFCAIIAGETQNTPRLTEAFLAGCVPVFIGPPWHAMPYPEFVDYKAASIAIHVTDTSRWANFGTKWSLERNAPRDVSRTHPKWWTPQLSAKDMEEVGSLEEIIDFLREYPESEYQAKLAAVYKLRGFFQWAPDSDGRSPAVDAALHKACEWGQEESKFVHMDF